MGSAEPQACVIRIDNSFSPFLPPFHSNNPSHAIERASKSLQGHSNWTGIFFFLSPPLLLLLLLLFFFCTSPKPHQLNAEESILLGVIDFDCHVKFSLPFSRCWYCSFGPVNLGEKEMERMGARQQGCHAIYPHCYNEAY